MWAAWKNCCHSAERIGRQLEAFLKRMNFVRQAQNVPS